MHRVSASIRSCLGTLLFFLNHNKKDTHITQLQNIKPPDPPSPRSGHLLHPKTAVPQAVLSSSTLSSLFNYLVLPDTRHERLHCSQEQVCFSAPPPTLESKSTKGACWAETLSHGWRMQRLLGQQGWRWNLRAWLLWESSLLAFQSEWDRAVSTTEFYVPNNFLKKIVC